MRSPKIAKLGRTSTPDASEDRFTFPAGIRPGQRQMRGTATTSSHNISLTTQRCAAIPSPWSLVNTRIVSRSRSLLCSADSTIPQALSTESVRTRRGQNVTADIVGRPL